MIFYILQALLHWKKLTHSIVTISRSKQILEHNEPGTETNCPLEPKRYNQIRQPLWRAIPILLFSFSSSELWETASACVKQCQECVRPKHFCVRLSVCHAGQLPRDTSGILPRTRANKVKIRINFPVEWSDGRSKKKGWRVFHNVLWHYDGCWFAQFVVVLRCHHYHHHHHLLGEQSRPFVCSDLFQGKPN